MEESSENKRVRLGQTCNKMVGYVFEQWGVIGILVFVEGPFGNMGLMKVSGADLDFLYKKGRREGFVFWF